MYFNKIAEAKESMRPKKTRLIAFLIFKFTANNLHF